MCLLFGLNKLLVSSVFLHLQHLDSIPQFHGIFICLVALSFTFQKFCLENSFVLLLSIILIFILFIIIHIYLVFIIFLIFLLLILHLGVIIHILFLGFLIFILFWVFLIWIHFFFFVLLLNFFKILVKNDKIMRECNT